MSMIFLDLINEVKRRTTRDQSGTQFDTAAKNLVNLSLIQIARESNWTMLRRKATITTDAEFTTGTLTATSDSNSYTGSSMSLITNNIKIGRRIQIQGSTQRYIIETITGENAFTTNLNYDGTTGAGKTHTIFGTEEYNLPAQVGKIALVWHEDYGYPFMMGYVTDEDFYGSGQIIENAGTPIYYRVWGTDYIVEQPLAGSVMSISSSAAADTSKDVTIFGIVSDYPDFEKITTNASDGTTASAGSKTFTKVERISKDASITGRITVTANSGNTTVAVLPVGAFSHTIEYKKIQIWPLPERAFDINVQYYKQPWYLVNDEDIHELGQDFDEAIILLASAKLSNDQSKGDDAVKFFQLYQNEIKNLKKTNMDTILSWRPKLRRSRDSRSSGGSLHRYLSFNQLGGNFGPMGNF